MPTTIASLNLSTNALTTLQEVGLADDESVSRDVAKLRFGEHTRQTLLDECLDGAEGEARIAAWTEYVDAVVAAAK